MGRLFAVVSGKGGVGKSSFCAMLAQSLSKQGKLLLIDLDTGLGCLDIMFNVSERVVFNLNDVIENGRELSEAQINCSDNIYLLSAPEREPDSKKFREFLLKIIDEYDYVILDFPAGKNENLIKGIPLFAEFLIICQANTVSIRDAEIISDSLSEDYLEKRLVINRFILKEKQKGIKKYTIDDIINLSSTRLIGIVPFDKNVFLLQSSRKVKAKSRAQKSVDRIATRLSGKRKPLPKLKKI